MYTFCYDGTFEGLLTVIFEVYERKVAPAQIVCAAAELPGLFTQTVLVVTDEVKADRVWQGLGKKVSAAARSGLYKAYLSEQPNAAWLIYQYARLAFASAVSIEDNYAADCVRQIAHLNKQIFRESHRMEAFIRFQKTADDLYYATVAPDFNVLPLIANHFQQRYADQRWLIFDTKRHYGLYYNLENVSQVNLTTEIAGHNGNLPENILAQQELSYQQLWQTYYQHVNIPSRNNPKLHLRHMPRRYWKYLTEKQPLRPLK